MYFEYFARIILVFINATGFLLMWWVTQSESKRAIKGWFVLMTICILSWANFSYLATRSFNSNLALIFYRLNWASVAMFLPSFYFFYIILFLKKRKLALIIGYLVIISSILLALLSLVTDLVISSIDPQGWGTGLEFGPLSIFFNLFSAIVALVVIIYSFKAYFSSDDEIKSKLKYFLIGIFIFIIANLIFNV